MRKTIVVVAALLALAAAGAYAEFSVGGEYLFDTSGLLHNALLTLRAWSQPFQLGIGATFGTSPSFSITADWWLRTGAISGSPLGYYIAAGGFVTLPALGFGARLPLGLQLWLAGDLLELFLEAVPYAGITVPGTMFSWGVGLGAGFRFWL